MSDSVVMTRPDINSDSTQKILAVLKKDQLDNPKLIFSYQPITKFLKISGATKFPDIFKFSNQVEILDISNSHLTKLPAEFKAFQSLKICFLSHNDFEILPLVLGEIPSLEIIGARSCKIATVPAESLPKNLRWLTLTDNKITRLPENIGKLLKLEKLLLAGNKLTALPTSISNCQNLALLRISANNFSASPLKLLAKLPKLAWYADAGNPFSAYQNLDQINLKHLAWKDIEIAEKIGESAQNKVFTAKIKKTSQLVALKVYSHQVTSDGYPEDEIAINLAIGDQPAIIKTIAKITHLPNKMMGLVLELIPSKFKRLGLPPSFQSCSRDVFPEKTTFTIEFISNLISEICTTCAKLYAKEIMHGDLYAHNILANKLGQAYLSDFGAASRFNKSKPEAKIKESIDILAFGYLIDDLLGKCKATTSQKFQKIDQIKKQCLDPIANNRPSFVNLNKITKTFNQN